MIKKKKNSKVSCSGLVRVSLFQEPIEEVMLADIMAATADFHSDHVVACGNPSLGTSYKAVLWDGSALTVKRIFQDWPTRLRIGISEQQSREEMRAIGRIRHPNLVPLLGFCFLEEEKILIYKNMPSGTLSSRLQSGDESLDWASRLRIGIGAARGLAWLHHGFQVPFLHQNLSSMVLLLDEDCVPRITEFGISWLLGLNPMSPLSIKGDVYEFGVLLLELATDHTNINHFAREEFKRNLVDWMLWLSAADEIGNAISQSLRGRGHDDQIVEFLKVACKCVAARPELRPSMYQVYELLKSIGGTQEFSEHFDEFPLLYNKD